MSRLLPLAAVLAGSPLVAGEVPGAFLVLEVVTPVPPHQVAGGLPSRFVLLGNGDVYVGGTSRLLAGRLDKPEVKEMEKRIELLRKLPGLGSRVSFGGEWPRFRLQVRKGRPLDILATGDPATAPGALRPLASLLQDLAAFDARGLHAYEPDNYALAVREGSLTGGCRAWSFPVALADALTVTRGVPAAAALDWPTGAVAASVCAGDKRYVVTLRPLLPGERP